MRIIFAGSPAPALPTLEYLVDSSHEVVGVLSRPDAPRGRGRKLQASAVAQYAQEHHLPLYQPRSLKNDSTIATILRNLSPDLGVVVAYGAILPLEILKIPRYGWINLHFSLLPRWRGAAPVQRAVQAGDTETGVTVFNLEPTLDTGSIYAKLRYNIPPNASAGEVLEDLSELAISPLEISLDKIVAGTPPDPQAQTGISYAPQLSVAEGQIDWTQNSEAISAHIRGFTPNPGAWTILSGLRFKIGVLASGAEFPRQAMELAPGQIFPTRQGVWVGTGSTPVCLGTIAPAGKKHMPAVDWARGARLEFGMNFDLGVAPHEADTTKPVNPQPERR
ncbi:methionyl-tRNA formyltransferase [Mobiluncus mulieris]|uniref:methionyl-tRNA formyltransferase n=1 Tax=Mobiluncus mulieris TaxID=2052 RepID=UPI00146FEBCB|nr:methionyl-tRNA formyltransferase [Mobiluncus mulieris]NMW62041.1 methionyl-tRNA formyltransferase [Mobiluncus mulieris]